MKLASKINGRALLENKNHELLLIRWRMMGKNWVSEPGWLSYHQMYVNWQCDSGRRKTYVILGCVGKYFRQGNKGNTNGTQKMRPHVEYCVFLCNTEQ